MSNPREARYSSVAGIPLHYSRHINNGYGREGINVNFYSTNDFKRRLEDCFQQLVEENPFGKPRLIVSAGIYVKKRGQHGRGRAIDVDSIYWSDRTLITYFYPLDTVLYLAVESIFRQHFGIVLNYRYDNPHKDHWHMDDGSPVDFFITSRSRVLYLQACLTHIYDHPVVVDGIWGPQTSGETQKVLTELGLGNDLEKANTWRAFLRKTAEKGFELVKQVPEPSSRELVGSALDTVFDKDIREAANTKLASTLVQLRDHSDITGSTIDSFGVNSPEPIEIDADSLIKARLSDPDYLDSE